MAVRELVADHVAFARAAVTRIAEPEARPMVARSLSALAGRLAEPHVRLVVIGEFSSGKSTLVNALLGAPVLAASPLPTTRIGTWVVPGPELTVTLAFRDRPPVGVDSGHQSWVRLAASLPDLAAHLLPGDFTGLLDRAVASAEVAHLQVTHPALPQGVVLIDTPALNADRPEERDQARRLTTWEADALVVAVPATAPLSRSLLSWLAEHLEAGATGRHAFVITGMDHVRGPDQRQRLVDNVRRRLATLLGLHHAVVLPAAPALTLEPVTDQWAEEFQRTRTEIYRLACAGAGEPPPSVRRRLDAVFGSLDWALVRQFETLSLARRPTDLDVLRTTEADLAETRRRRSELARSRTTTGQDR